MGIVFRIGDRVVKNPATWQVNEFDSWGRGMGVGVVVEPSFAVDDLDEVDVRWPSGRCFEKVNGLLPAPGERFAEQSHPLELASGPDSNGQSAPPDQ
jgi:hypothetical protein